MKKNYIFITLMLLALLPATAQTPINFDATNFSPDPIGLGFGFMNVFDNPKDGSIGGYQYSSGWGIADLVGEFDTGANTLTLKPNRIGDTDPYWQSAGVLEGNKIMDANCFIQDDTLVGTSFTFNGNVISNTLDDSGLSFTYTQIAFIKVFNADFSTLLMEDTAPLTAGDFTLSMDATAAPVDAHVQYGFQIIGPNINSDGSFNTAYDNIGSIVVQPATLSLETFSANEFSIYPNPSTNNWNVKGTQEIRSIQVFDVLGKKVIDISPETSDVLIDASTLNSGLYFARINSENGTKTLKLIKK